MCEESRRESREEKRTLVREIEEKTIAREIEEDG